MKVNICKKCNNGHIQHSDELCPECLEKNKNGNDLYSGEALKQDPHVKKLLNNARSELINGNLKEAKILGRQAESLEPLCSTVLSFMGEVCRACGEEALAMDYFTRAMQLPKCKPPKTESEQITEFPRHIWLAAILLLFVITSAIAMMIAVNSKKTEISNHMNVIKTSSVISEPSWVWQGATIYNVEQDKTVIPENEINMTGASDAYHSGNYRRATAIYTKLLKSKDVDPYIYQYLAYSYQRMGDSQHALQMLQKCIKKCSMKHDKDMPSIEKNKQSIKKLLDSRVK